MAVQNQVVKNVYTGNGINRIFYYTFELDKDKGDDVRVFVTDEEGFSTETTDFTVNTNNKSITYPKTETNPPITVNQKISIFRVTPVEQTTNFENQGAYFAEDVEKALDNLTLMVQENREQIKRAIKADPASDEDPQEVWRQTKETMQAILDAEKSVEDEDRQLREDIDAILAEAQAHADAAGESATNAAQSETNALQSSSTATIAAQNAAQAASRAESAAGSAADVAVAAVTGLVNQAQAHANAAANSAQTATSSATIATSASTNAQTAANTATAQATSAANSAAAAKVSEESADDSALAAANSAATAGAYETNFRQLAEQAADNLLNAVQGVVADVTTKADAAAQSAQNAQSTVETASTTLANAVAADKQAAQDAMTSARLYAEAASNSATSASNSEAASEVNANVASTAAATATEKATQVRADAESASASATAAAQSEVNATAAVNEAYLNAQQAKVSADAAANSATEAANQAGRAGTYAKQAQESADDAAESTTQAKRLAKATMDRIAVSSVGIPAQEGTLTYNGEAQSPTWDLFYEADKMITSGVTSATDAGTYTAIITPAEGYYWWEDNTVEPKEITWTIKRQPLQATPSQVGSLTYNGDEQSPSWRDYSPSSLVRSGDLTGVEEGRYSTAFTPTANYCWEDGTTDAREVEWRIFALVIDIPTVTETSKIYNRAEQSPTIGTFDPMVVDCTGDKATDAGEYIVTLHLRSASVTWSDGTRADRNTQWTIARKVVDIPVVSDTSKTYNSASQTPTISTFDENEITLGGDITKLHAGNYTLTMTLTSTSNYVWSDETTGVKERTWNIARKAVDVPQVTSTDKTYSGDEQSPNILDYDEDAITVSGTTAATEPGTYTIYFSLVTGEGYADYIWSDETTGRKEATWSISQYEITVPSVTGVSSWVYDKDSHAPTISNPDAEYVDITGDTEATNAGEYTITFSLKNTITSVWTDGTTAPKTATWSITVKDIAIPTLTNTDKTYNTIEQYPTRNNVTAGYVTVGGTTAATDAGTYTVTWTLDDAVNTRWTDGTNAAKSDSWTIAPKSVAIPTLTDAEQTYTGSEVHPTISTFLTTEVSQTGVAAATQPDSYTVYWNLTSTKNYIWTDDTTSQKSATWTITRITVAVPTLSDGTKTYNKSPQSPTISTFDTSKITQSGTATATDAGDYTVTWTLASELYQWTDGTTAAKSAAWTIEKAPVAIPAMPSKTSFVFNAQTQAPDLEYDSSKITVTGTASSKDVGDFTVWMIPTSNYKWDGGAVPAGMTKRADGYVTFPWTITKAQVAAKFYGKVGADGTYAEITFSGTTADGIAMVATSYFGGNISVKADRTLFLAIDYVSSDGSGIFKDITTSTGKKVARLTDQDFIDKNAAMITDSGARGGLLAPFPFDYNTTTKQYKVNPSVPLISRKATSFTIAQGTTVSAAPSSGYDALGYRVQIESGFNYDITNMTNAGSEYSFNLLVPFLIAKALNDYTWDEISSIAKSGDAAQYFEIGECKEITLNGQIGDYLTLSNQKLCVFILDINHPTNGTAENNIIFGGFKTALSGGVDVALVDGKTHGTSGELMFNINHWGSATHGGWRGCDLRYDILGATSKAPSGYGAAKVQGCTGYDATAITLTNPRVNTLLAAFPSELRSNIRIWERWIDVIGEASGKNENINVTKDAITLLIESEASSFGGFANRYESNYNTRMAYFKNGNSRMKKAHSDTSAGSGWWESSPCYTGHTFFCIVDAGGDCLATSSADAYGLAPAFKI